MSLQVVYITCSSREEAKKLAKILLEKKLIACANIYPVDSLYTWEGELKQETEFVLWAKTISEKIDLIKDLVSQEHSYDIPTIVSFPADSNESYYVWVNEQMN